MKNLIKFKFNNNFFAIYFVLCYYLTMDNNYYKTLALDLGERRIGIAISDLMGVIANGLETYTRVNLDDDCKHIANIIKNNSVKEVVLGLPKNMDGTCGPRVEKKHAFAERRMFLL